MPAGRGWRISCSWMGLDGNVVPGSSLGIVPDLHQLTRRGIDETLTRFLPGTTRCDGRPVAPTLEENRGDHDGAVDEQVEDQPDADAGEREGDGADEREDAVGK